MTDPVLERALRAVGRARAIGLHFYGHFAGISGRPPSAGRGRLELEGEPPGVGSPYVSAAAFATLADLATGGIVRSYLTPGELLATMTLSIQHFEAGVTGLLVAEAEGPRPYPEHGAARCTIRAGDRLVGQAQGWFSIRPTPPGFELGLMPWEYEELPETPLPSLDDLDEQEAAAVAAARAAGRRAAQRGTAVSDELFVFEWAECPAGRAYGTLKIGPELGNRVGAVQGGALYGAAATSATRALNLPEAALAEGHYQFLRPAFGKVLTAEATLLRRGQSVAFVDVRVSADDKLVGSALVSFRL